MPVQLVQFPRARHAGVCLHTGFLAAAQRFLDATRLVPMHGPAPGHGPEDDPGQDLEDCPEDGNKDSNEACTEDPDGDREESTPEYTEGPASSVNPEGAVGKWAAPIPRLLAPSLTPTLAPAPMLSPKFKQPPMPISAKRPNHPQRAASLIELAPNGEFLFFFF